MKRELPMSKLVLEKAEEPEIKLPTCSGSLKKQEISRKTSIWHRCQILWLCSDQFSSVQLLNRVRLFATPWIAWITTNCGKFLNRWEYQTAWCASWEICMQVRKQQLELDMEQQTGYKKEKEYVKAVYCYPYLTYMQSTSWEVLGWRKHKLESRLPGEISITTDMLMTPPLWQRVKSN